MVNQGKALKTFDFFVKEAEKYNKKEKHEQALMAVVYAAKLAYNLNLKCYDARLEKVLKDISEKTLGNLQVSGKINRYVFYDCFASANHGLSQQYLRALNAMDAQILLIVKKDETKIDNLMLQEIQGYNKMELFCVDARYGDCINAAKKIAEKIKEFEPTYALIHMAPEDVVGNLVWNSFGNIKKFMVNLTDHSFWLGANWLNYSLEFRSYGYNLSIDYRNIPEEKLLIQPFYPIAEGEAFQGFFGDSNDYVKLFSGGAIYKVCGRNNFFFRMVKRILEENPQTVFYYAGGGDLSVMKSYIEENGLKERWHLIGNRSDIVEVMKHMDIYIGTYPWGGGLMTQIAAMCEKPIVSYIDQGERFSLIEENFLNQDHIPKLSYSNEEEFYQKIKLLVEDSERRKEEGKRLKLELISPEVFCSNLQEILEKKESRFSPEKYSVNMEQFRKLYFDIENNYLHVYDRLLLNKIMVAKRPFQTLRSLVLYLRNVDKKSLWNKFKMRMK